MQLRNQSREHRTPRVDDFPSRESTHVLLHPWRVCATSGCNRPSLKEEHPGSTSAGEAWEASKMASESADRGNAMIQRVDNGDLPIGGIQRNDALRLGANFRVVHILIMNRHNELLLQRTPSHARHPDHWGSSVAGHVGLNESYDAAAIRKLREELGVHAQPGSLGGTSVIDGASRKFIGVYLLPWDGPISPNPSDYGALCFVPIDRINMWRRNHGVRFTSTSLHVLRFVRGAHPHLNVDPQL